jgi:hypothetical protein
VVFKDSIDKIITTYFAAVTNEEFSYKGKVYTPKTLVVSPLIFRGYVCNIKCGACCSRFSLDYIPSELPPYELQKRFVTFNNREYIVLSDLQLDQQIPSHFCKHLNMKEGLCGIHGKHPFTCDFELLRFLKFADDARPNRVMTKHYGRAWSMTQIDGTKGTKCEILPVSQEARDDVVRKFMRLQDWANHFELKTKLPSIISWCLGADIDSGEDFRI